MTDVTPASVKLISITQPVIPGVTTPEEFIA